MNIHPFAAVRPNEKDAASVASVPYDVVDTAEARALAEGHPRSFLHVSRPEIDLPDGTGCSSPEAYAQARKALDKLRDDGVLVRDFVPCVKVEGGVETVGLYDVSRNATKRFYENGGSGAALVAGPELPEPPSGFVFFLR